MSRISVLCLICICPSSYISSLHSYCPLSYPGLETWGHAWLLSFSPHLVHYQVLWIPSPKSLSSPFSPHSLSLPLGCHHFLSGALMESSSPLSQSVHIPAPVYMQLLPSPAAAGAWTPWQETYVFSGRKWVFAVFVHLFFIYIHYSCIKQKFIARLLCPWHFQGLGQGTDRIVMSPRSAPLLEHC